MLPDKKRYAEFITALLSIPVLITVLLTNLNSLNSKDKTPQPSSNDKNIIISYVPQKEDTNNTSPTPDTTNCKKGIGDVQIITPKEGETITDNPATVRINNDEEYCTVVWSYRINDGKWSEFDDNSVSLYNLKNGDIRFELRVKSTTNKEEKILTRRFTYDGNEEPNPTSIPTVTPSGL